MNLNDLSENRRRTEEGRKAEIERRRLEHFQRYPVRLTPTAVREMFAVLVSGNYNLREEK